MVTETVMTVTVAEERAEEACHGRAVIVLQHGDGLARGIAWEDPTEQHVYGRVLCSLLTKFIASG